MLLGILQGLTEFFPVSSSAHLTLLQWFFGFHDLENYIAFDLICHLGTVCSIFVVYHRQVKQVIRKDPKKLVQIAIGTLPLLPIVLILKPIENLFDKPELIGLFLLCTTALLYAGIRWGHERPTQSIKESWKRDAFVIGLFQAIAIMPGISRSGATLSGARLLGWKREDAVSFAFLLAIPAIIGGVIVKSMAILLQSEANTQFSSVGPLIIGFLSAFITGCFALQFLIRLVSKDKLMYFVAYCFLLGTGLSLYFMMAR